MNISERFSRAARYYNNMNLPNFLTLSRIIAIPFFIVALSYGYMGSALAIFACCGLTDGLDGFIARTFHQRTKIGAFLDPLADKLLLTSTFLTLTLVTLPNTIPLWLVVTVISRDIIITVGIAALFMLGIRFPIAPTIVGKLTTFLQVSLILVVLFHNYINVVRPRLILSVSWLTFIVTAISGVGYLYQGIRLLNSHSEQIEQDKTL